jgi:hypothetical protein
MLTRSSNLSILHTLSGLVLQLKEVAALQFFQYSPVRSLNFGFFHTFSLIRLGEYLIDEIFSNANREAVQQ